MKSDLEKFLSVLFELLHDIREQMGPVAWVALGVMLVAAIFMGALALRWIRRRGLRAGTARQFFATRHMIHHWLRTH